MPIPGGWELIVVVLLIMVLFGYKKLPEATRSLGKSVRIFKSEMRDDDVTSAKTATVETTGTETTGTTASVEAPRPVPESPLLGDEQSRRAKQDRPHQQP